MNPQVDLFDAEQAVARRDAALRWVASNPVNRQHRLRLIAAIEELARTGTTFSADHVRAYAGEPPEGVSPNLVGSIVNHAAKAGLIHFVGFTKSARVIGHSNTVRLWRGR